MVNGEIHVEDVGTTIEITVSEGITGIASVTAFIQKPNFGSINSASCSVISVTNGVVAFESTATTFTTYGDHPLQARFNFGNGKKFFTVTEILDIKKTIIT